VALAGVSIWALWLRPETGRNPAPVIRSSINLPEGERLAWPFRHAVAVSPDGQWLAYASRDYKLGEGNVPTGQPVVNLRRLDQTEVRRIPGFNPFFSSDSRQLGFLEPAGPSQFDLKRTRVEGGPLEQVTSFEDPDEGGGFGFSWLPDGTIVFAPREGEGLYRVTAVGGEPRPLTHPGMAVGEYDHRLPSPMPDGHTILYTEVRYSSGDWSQARIVALRLESGEKKVLIEGASDGRYVASGHLLFAREGRLMAVQFDADRLEVKGDPVPVLDGLAHSIHAGNSKWDTGAAQYGVSSDGLLVFGSGSVLSELPKELVWVDREGHEELLAIEPKAWLSARISPDTRQVLLTSDSGGAQIVWLFDLERESLRRQSFDGQCGWALWGPGTGEFTFRSNPEGPQGTYVKSIDSGPGTGEKLPIEFSTFHAPSSWHPDGRRLAFVTQSPESNYDIWILDRQSGTEPFLQTRFSEKWPEFSPDGRWLAYTSDESGRDEVYVRPFPGPGKAVQISSTEGLEPCWSRDGKEIFYYSLLLFDPIHNQQPYFAARIRISGHELRADPPKRLFAGRYQGAWPVRSFDADPDGRFLLIKREADSRTRILDALAPSHIELVQNWFEELRAKVPVD
jgi:serine/threonine-protein kinase